MAIIHVNVVSLLEQIRSALLNEGEIDACAVNTALDIATDVIRNVDGNWDDQIAANVLENMAVLADWILSRPNTLSPVTRARLERVRNVSPKFYWNPVSPGRESGE